MFKGLMFSVAAMLLVCPQVFAVIAQDQDYTIGANTVASLFGGVGMVGDGKIAVVCLGQTTTTFPCGPWAIQDDNAIFTQKAFGIGFCSVLGILQTGRVLGCQYQFLTGFDGPKFQGQELDVGLTQQITKGEGAGAASASHEFIADRMQVSASPSGSMSADQFLNTAQDSNVLAAPCTDASVISGAYISLSQVQVDN